MTKKLVPINDYGFKKNKNLKKPGDKVSQEITATGDIITKVNTEEKKATHRQYVKKDGTLGKQTITIMQPDNSK